MPKDPDDKQYPVNARKLKRLEDRDRARRIRKGQRAFNRIQRQAP